MKYLKNKKYIITNNLIKLSFVFMLGFVIIAPLLFAGQVGAENATTEKVVVKTNIDNPLGENLRDIPSFIKKVIEIVLSVGIPILVLAIIYTGFLFVQAQGNKDKLTDAKKSLTGVLIGGALLLGAFVIAEAIGSTVDEIKSNV
jgi:hypothetical protein